MKRRKVIPGTYSSTINEIMERAIREKYGEGGPPRTTPGEQRYFSLKIPLEMKRDFLEIKSKLSLDSGENLSNVDVCRIVVEAAHRELVKKERGE